MARNASIPVCKRALGAAEKFLSSRSSTFPSGAGARTSPSGRPVRSDGFDTDFDVRAGVRFAGAKASAKNFTSIAMCGRSYLARLF